MQNQPYQFNFEKLEVWHESRKFTCFIYALCNNFPRCENFGLKNQLQRASVSIAANIAEGSSRLSRKDYAHFIQVAYSSLMEVLSHCYLAYDLSYIKRDELHTVKNEIHRISTKLNALHRYLSK